MQNCVITNKGLELVAEALSSSGQIVFTNAKTSAHQYTPQELKGLQTLEQIQQTVAISSVEKVSAKTLKVAAVFTNAELLDAYNIRTIGIYAKKAGASNDALFAVAIENDEPKHLPAFPGAGRPPSSVVYHLYVSAENAGQVALSVAPGGVASAGDLNAHRDLRVLSEQGVHGIRYKSKKLEVLGPSSVWETVEHKAKIQDFTIDTTGWQEYTSADNDYKKKKAIPITGITADDIPVLNYDLASRNAAQDANASHVESEAGQIVVYAEKVPSKALTGTLVIERGER